MCAVEGSLWTESWLPNKEWSEAGYPSSPVLCNSHPQDGWGIIRQRSSAILHRNGQVGGTHKSSGSLRYCQSVRYRGVRRPSVSPAARLICGGRRRALLWHSLPLLIYLLQEMATKEKTDREGENKNVAIYPPAKWPTAWASLQGTDESRAVKVTFAKPAE